MRGWVCGTLLLIAGAVAVGQRHRAVAPPYTPPPETCCIRYGWEFVDGVPLGKSGTFTLYVDGRAHFVQPISGNLESLHYSTVLPKSLAFGHELRARITDSAGNFEEAARLVTPPGFSGTNDPLGVTVAP